MQHHFSIDESLKFGWHKTKAHSALLFQVLLTLFALEVVSAIVNKVLAHTAIGTIASLALVVAGIFLGVGFTVITLKLARNEHASYADILPSGSLVWQCFVAGLLAGLLMLIGFVLLIIPGLYLMMRYSMVRFAVIDGASITESLERSARITKGVKLQLLLFFIVMILLNILGAVLLLVGLLVSIPVTSIAFAHIYQKLHIHHGPHKAH